MEELFVNIDEEEKEIEKKKKKTKKGEIELTDDFFKLFNKKEEKTDITPILEVTETHSEETLEENKPNVESKVTLPGFLSRLESISGNPDYEDEEDYDDDFNDFDNLAEKPSAPGAWIVENSYGPDSNDGGYYYLSYYSGTMRNPSVYMSRIERGAVDTIMMKDRLGFVSAINFSNNIVTLHSYFANPQGSEIRAVGIYTTQVTTKVNVSLVKGSYPGDASEPLLSKDTVLAFAGYHVIGVCPTFFAAGDSIGLVVRYEQNESKNVSIPFERSNSSGTAIVENVGDQYIKNGDVWHNVGIVWPDANLLTKLYCKNVQAVNAVDEAQASGNVGLRAWASGGSDITIEVCAPSEVAVYDMCGKLVENVNVDWRKTVQVPSGGVYVVTSNGESVKVQK